MTARKPGAQPPLRPGPAEVEEYRRTLSSIESHADMLAHAFGALAQLVEFAAAEFPLGMDTARYLRRALAVVQAVEEIDALATRGPGLAPPDGGTGR